MGGPEPLILALGAGLAGAMAGLVPGLHANTLATAVLLLALDGRVPQAWATPMLMGLLGAWTFANTVPLIVLGVPEGEDAPALLPGQRMARDGHAAAAVRASARGSLVGLVAGTTIALGLAWGAARVPIVDLLPAATPWIQGVAIVILVVSDPAGPTRSVLAVGLAGALGFAALDLPVASPLGWPATPLIPLFIGLFGLPALVRAARAGPRRERVHPIDPPRTRPARLSAGLVGSALGAVAGTVAGFTAGPATAIAVQLRRGRDADVLATTSAVNTTIAAVATGLLHATGSTRTGVHAAQLALTPPPPGLDALAQDLAGLAMGALPGLLVLRAAARHGDGLARLVPGVAPALVVLWAAIVGLQTGLAGGLVLAAGWATARAVAKLGARRSVLMACLLVPGFLDAVLPFLGG